MNVNLKELLELFKNDTDVLEILKNTYLGGRDYPDSSHIAWTSEGVLKCLHCGEIEDMNKHLPLSLGMSEGLFRGFLGSHLFCDKVV